MLIYLILALFSFIGMFLFYIEAILEDKESNSWYYEGLSIICVILFFISLFLIFN